MIIYLTASRQNRSREICDASKNLLFQPLLLSHLSGAYGSGTGNKDARCCSVLTLSALSSPDRLGELQDPETESGAGA